MKIIAQNQQHRYKFEQTKIKTMADKLSLAVFDNLRKRKPKWLANLSIIEKSSLLSLIIVSPQTIRKLNKQWLGKDKETDVLSFPLIDLSDLDKDSELSSLSHFCEPSHNSKSKTTKARTEDNYFELGEIFISYQQAIRQAKEYNHSLERELAFLFVHGLLHILGFDHENKAAEKEMFGRQNEILVKAGYAR
jgi:probable rRNA maturation factor